MVNCGVCSTHLDIYFSVIRTIQNTIEVFMSVMDYYGLLWTIMKYIGLMYKVFMKILIPSVFVRTILCIVVVYLCIFEIFEIVLYTFELHMYMLGDILCYI